MREVLRAEIVDGVRLLGRRTAEERGTVHDGIHAAHGGRERIDIEQIADDELDSGVAEIGGAHGIAHEGADVIAALGKAFGESASDLSGRTGDENLHAPNVASGIRGRLEETDKRARHRNPGMNATTALHDRVLPGTRAASVLAALSVDELERDMPRVAIPRPEIHLVVRFGPSTATGLDVHALGVRETVHRKLVRRGHRIVMARLRLGATEAVLGVRASALAGRIVPLGDLWGDAAAGRLSDRLASARDTSAAAKILESAIAERVALTHGRSACTALALAAADRLASASVNAVAVELGVSDRHLRRVFRETFGLSPKAFAKLARFHRALNAARTDEHAGWASIAAMAGYYDQAHLIAEFRAIAGVTPRAFLGELRAGA